MSKKIKIGTRTSALAVRQAEIAARALENRGMATEIVTIKTTGDKILDKTLDKIGGKGVFVKEIEQALLLGEIDMAVHSMKDMPQELPKGLVIGAVTKREFPMDAYVSNKNVGFYDLPSGAKIGTGSQRRKMQLLALRDDIEVVSIRGNIQTRLQKLSQGIDGVILAQAGLKRCNVTGFFVSPFSVLQMVPAACQGILALELKKEDTWLLEQLKSINDEEADICQKGEREFLKTLGADCHAPVGVYARLEQNEVVMDGVAYKNKIYRVFGKCPKHLSQALGRELGEKIISHMENEGDEKI